MNNFFDKFKIINIGSNKIKTEYIQSFACEEYMDGRMSTSRIKIVEATGEAPLYFHNGEPITEQEFRKLYGKFKTDSTLVETKEISQYYDAGKRHLRFLISTLTIKLHYLLQC